MSQEDVEVVRRFNGPYDGDDTLPAIRQALERFGPDPRPEVVLARWAEDAAWQHVHPDIEWDLSATGALGEAVHGPGAVALWWAAWVEVWESYVYRVLSYRDLGAWVLTPTQIRARARDGMAVEMMLFQLWQVRDDKIAVLRTFLSEREALEAAGLRE